MRSNLPAAVLELTKRGKKRFAYIPCRYYIYINLKIELSLTKTKHSRSYIAFDAHRKERWHTERVIFDRSKSRKQNTNLNWKHPESIQVKKVSAYTFYSPLNLGAACTAPHKDVLLLSLLSRTSRGFYSPPWKDIDLVRVKSRLDAFNSLDQSPRTTRLQSALSTCLTE